MSSLVESEKKTLLQVARDALTAAITTASYFPADAAADSSLAQPGSAFVTIFRKGRLRGCIGQLSSKARLVDVVAHCAHAVASQDPRFRPVQPEELPEIDIEISVLSELSDIKPEEIETGGHGLMVSSNSHRGVLLPQVAIQFHWNRIRFLEATCEKAGLSKDAWKNAGTRIQAFTAEVFSDEAEFRNYSSST
jgi:AmmeMemoRadiSam system protein A